MKDEGTASGLTKEEIIETNERLRAVRLRLDESYDTAKKALISLMAKYNDSKNVHNIFQRYNLLKAMIKVSVSIHRILKESSGKSLCLFNSVTFTEKAIDISSTYTVILVVTTVTPAIDTI